jgi:hypothetical protein
MMSYYWSGCMTCASMEPRQGSLVPVVGMDERLCY